MSNVEFCRCDECNLQRQRGKIIDSAWYWSRPHMSYLAKIPMFPVYLLAWNVVFLKSYFNKKKDIRLDIFEADR